MRPPRTHELGPRGPLLGAYEVVGLVGQGGMSKVFAARHRLTGQMRALKVLHRHLGRDRLFVERFLREVRLAASIDHENLVRVLEPGMENSLVYLPMELLEGETLAHLLERCKRLPERDVVALLLCLCRGVDAMHGRGIVHRDLKPSNAFLSIEGHGAITPKVLDFGTARELRDDSECTRTGVVLGTPFYMAPEQAVGASDVDLRADIYALGVIAYQLVTGARPYENDARRSALTKLIADDPYPDLCALQPTLSEGFAACVRRAMARDRERRFSSAHELAGALIRATPSGDAAGDWRASATQRLSGRCALSVAAVPTTGPYLERTIALAGLDDSAVFDVLDASARRDASQHGGPRVTRPPLPPLRRRAVKAVMIALCAAALLATGVWIGTRWLGVRSAQTSIAATRAPVASGPPDVAAVPAAPRPEPRAAEVLPRGAAEPDPSGRAKPLPSSVSRMPRPTDPPKQAGACGQGTGRPCL